MNQEVETYREVVGDILEQAHTEGADVQRYIVAPAMLEIIGQVNGNDVLDLYCGAGYLSRRLAALGANVTAVDSSEKFIGIAAEINKRESNGIRYAVAEPTDLSVIEDSTFDDIVCNMGLLLARDLGGTVAELARLIKLGGRLIFSHVHPCFCGPDAAWVGGASGSIPYITIGSYFTESWWTPDIIAELRDNRTKVKHRTLSALINALSARGFNVRRMFEPRPSPEVLTLKPNLEVYDRVPVAIVVEAVFPFL
jgi:2-polyprenyl-3-methyl-5-hydroxy-6-metoxy-1,4-benzoquinol methylase